MPLRLTVNALRLQGTGINPVSVLIPFKVLILEVSPAFPLGNKVFFAFGRCFPETCLFCATALRLFGVSPFKILLRVTVNTVINAFREHDMGVGLLATGYRCFRIMDSELIGMAVANFLLDKIADKLKTLFGF